MANPKKTQTNPQNRPPAARPAPRSRRKVASPDAGPAVRVRMYRHGLGDCLLLAFPKTGGGDYFVLIDCGVILGTPNAAPLMATVAEDILKSTGGRVDVLVVTHEHWDHVSGFVQAKTVFDRLDVGEVWFAWTEDPAEETARRLRRDRAERLAALWLGASWLRARLSAADASAEDAAAVDRAAEVLSFFGVDPAEPPPEGGFAAAAAANKTETVMRWVRDKAPPRYWRPGDVVDLPATGGVRAHVLGPPIHLPQLFKDLPTKVGRETYELATGAEAVSALSLFGAALSAADAERVRPEFDLSVPFDPKYQITPAQAADVAFFRDHYLSERRAEGWRRIDGEWMAAAAEFALKLDSDTNNTSLALAFELPDGQVLLFPADAQVGNWESWHDRADGTRREWTAGNRRVTAEALLSRTVLYKVGHHGSHNATLRDRGLEMMTAPDLVALMPVDTHVARNLKRWSRMPFDPLVARLRAGPARRLVAADEPLTGPIRAGAWSLTDSTATITVAGPAGDVTRPLYVEWSLAVTPVPV